MRAMLLTAAVAAEAVARGVPFWLTVLGAAILLLGGAGMLLIWLISRSRGRPSR